MPPTAACLSPNSEGHFIKISLPDQNGKLSDYTLTGPHPLAGAYLEQVNAIRKLDARLILMASRALGRVAKGPQDYLRVYDRVLSECDHPVVLHGLGAMFPTVPLARLIFRAPTRFDKTGVVFLAWLNRFQDHFIMLNGAQAMRPLPYFTDVFRLADGCGLLRNPDMAVDRMRKLMALHGA